MHRTGPAVSFLSVRARLGAAPGGDWPYVVVHWSHAMADAPTLSYEQHPPASRRSLTTCSYCGRTNRETGPQIEGPWKLLRGRAYMCARCVDVAADIVKQGRERGVIPPASNGAAAAGPAR
jgi:hypothetical protein